MIACYECGRAIKGEVVHVDPPLFAIQLGDFCKTFHPKCYEKAETRAEKELRVNA